MFLGISLLREHVHSLMLLWTYSIMDKEMKS